MVKKKGKSVFLRGLKPENHLWLKTEAKKQGYTLSGFTNKLLEDAKKNARNSR